MKDIHLKAKRGGRRRGMGRGERRGEMGRGNGGKEERQRRGNVKSKFFLSSDNIHFSLFCAASQALFSKPQLRQELQPMRVEVASCRSIFKYDNFSPPPPFSFQKKNGM